MSIMAALALSLPHLIAGLLIKWPLAVYPITVAALDHHFKIPNACTIFIFTYAIEYVWDCNFPMYIRLPLVMSQMATALVWYSPAIDNRKMKAIYMFPAVPRVILALLALAAVVYWPHLQLEFVLAFVFDFYVYIHRDK